MSTLELADLLNQEVVENPMLEEVAADDAQASETASADKAEGDAEATAPKSDNWDDSDYAYFFGDRGLEGRSPCR